jgi:hypothetical protein
VETKRITTITDITDEVESPDVVEIRQPASRPTRFTPFRADPGQTSLICATPAVWCSQATAPGEMIFGYTSLRMRTICSSLYRHFFMAPTSLEDAIL